MLNKTAIMNAHIVELCVSSVDESMTFTVFDNNRDRKLLEVSMGTRRGIVVFLECFDMEQKELKNHLRVLKQKWSTKIIKFSGKAGEDADMLKDKPDPEDEFEAFAEVIQNLSQTSHGMWNLIRETGFHEFLPIK